MIRAASWNVRGLNGLDHQRAVEHLVRDHKLSFIGLIETRVSQANVHRTRRNLLINWSWFEDYSGPAGRIWLTWNSLEVGVEILEVGIQFIHCRAFNKRMHTRCLISVLYGAYDIIPRRELWSALRNLSTGIWAEPWLVLGDFNAVIDESEVCGQAADTSASMLEFRNCIRDTGLVQLPFTGCPYTWHNCSEGPRSLWKRLDRMLVNKAWLDTWPSSSYLSALPSTSDHSPLILTGTNSNTDHAVFKFDNYLAQLPGFLDSVENIWKHHISGTAMYESVCKLKLLKSEFRRLKKRTGNLTENVQRAKTFLDKAQSLFATYKEDIFLNLVKCCRRVYSAAIKLENQLLDLEFLRPALKHTITTAEASLLVAPVTQSEVKEAFFDIDVESAPGPDGFTSAFYRAAWPIVGQSMFESVGEFFRTGKLLKQINTTLLALIPKVNMPTYVSDYRPISCCNVLYKAITKIIVKRLQRVLPLLITYSQNAFVPGLKVNPAKSQIILSRAVQQQRQQILEHLGFQEGSLPIKYLGIPLTSSRLTIADCRPLLDKVDTRLAGWNHQTMSYAGRLQLIKSVLSTLHTYWASVFILPKGVLKILEKKMRTFLWQGQSGTGKCESGNNYGGYCKMMERQYGWIGFSNTGFVIQRFGHSIVQRVRGVGRKMLKLRPLLQRGVIYKVGDGSSFSLWQDIWHERGPLCLSYPRGPAVTDCLCHRPFPACYRGTNGAGRPRQIRILLKSSPTYLQHNLQQQTAYVGSATRDSTRCSQQNCSFSRQIRRFIGMDCFKNKVRFQWPYLDWKQGITWASKKWRGNHLITAALRATLAALVYHIWAERNQRKFSATSSSAESISNKVLEDVRMRIMAAETSFKLTS
ncbi:UNVERIFIED_CONTAM: hypothetical protein Scaly_2943700 [Sesamum calycinum]|uniref:Endonuclease/exonuclease/phosphatase domain-containing protein n=1 Tax=Sesamum calycinum TaxID=2727403 RepID=A0AAW2KTB4_9LAMI